jgi:beta-galactosidase/beta-glucuronidase
MVLTILALAERTSAQNGQQAVTGARATMSLDGPWRIVFDRDNVGYKQGWHKPAVLDRQAGREIPVPSGWEEHEQDYEGVAWYSRQIDVPAAWKGRSVRLQFDAVNYITQVWVDGQVVGEHEGGYGPFEFDVSDHLEYGKPNVVTLRVVGPAIVSERVDTLVRNAAPHWRGAYLGGIWQSVRIVVTDPVYVSDVFIEPLLNESLAKTHVELVNTSLRSRAVVLQVDVASARQLDKSMIARQAKVLLPPGQQRVSMALPITDVVPWSPNNPHLYVAGAKLLAGDQTIDAVDRRFGMRSFEPKDGDFYLNGRRIYIKGAFWEGQYPNTLAHPRDLSIVRKEIELAKKAGFNMLRPWRMPPVPAIIDLCDEMGMLLSGAPAIENMGYWPAETTQKENPQKT